MKAVFIRAHGDAGVLEYGEMPEPSPGHGEVKVRVRAAAMNRLDVYTRQGVRGARVPEDRFPHVLGGDAAGEVAALGEGVDRLQVGQRVVINPMLGRPDPRRPDNRMLGTHAQGTYAEYVVVPAANVYPFADHLTDAQAAALPTVFLPSWGMVVREGRLRPEETALVLSSSSGVGTAAVQLVKQVVGARCIAATSTGEKARLTRELGADHVINYTVEDLASRLRQLTRGHGVDLVVDSVGSQFFPAAFGALARGGRYGVCGVTTGYTAELHLGQLFVKEAKLFGVFMGPPADMRRVLAEAARGRIRSVIRATFPLHRAKEAHELMESGRHFGKIVLTIP